MTTDLVPLYLAVTFTLNWLHTPVCQWIEDTVAVLLHTITHTHDQRLGLGMTSLTNIATGRSNDNIETARYTIRAPVTSVAQ